MRILILCVLLSCNTLSLEKSQLYEKVKWDFYKKNIDKYFEVDGSKIPFYSCQLKVELISDKINGDSLNCYYGKFYIEGSDINSIYNGNIGVPTVNTICYNSLLSIVEYYVGDHGRIRAIDPSEEILEDENLCFLINSGIVKLSSDRFHKCD